MEGSLKSGKVRVRETWEAEVTEKGNTSSSSEFELKQHKKIHEITRSLFMSLCYLVMLFSSLMLVYKN